MWNLDERNQLHKAEKDKISKFASNEELVVWRRTVERDLALIPVSRTEVLQGLLVHLETKTVSADHMDNGDLAYICEECMVAGVCLYLKVKFATMADGERLIVFAAHPPRRW